MSKPSEKKRQKQRERERENAKKKAAIAMRRIYEEAFPRFEYQNRDAPPELVELVKQTVEQIDFRSPPFGGWWENALRKGKKNPKCIRKIIEIGETNTEVPIAFVLSCKIGQTVFDMIGDEELKKWIPFHDIQFLLTGTRVMVLFRALMTEHGKWGTTYYSRHKPTIEVDGKKYLVGFSRHAIERICERIEPNWVDYADLGSAFSIFDECVYFERSDFFDGQLAFTFYAPCMDGFFSGSYVEHILLEAAEKNHYYRIGYCPFKLDNGFARAMTLLVPGQRPTPEYGLMMQSGLPQKEIEEMRLLAKKMNKEYLRETFDFSLLKWFHDRGIPQVITSSKELYKSPIPASSNILLGPSWRGLAHGHWERSKFTDKLQKLLYE